MDRKNQYGQFSRYWNEQVAGAHKMTFSIKDSSVNVKFTEQILDGKLHFLGSELQLLK